MAGYPLRERMAFYASSMLIGRMMEDNLRRILLALHSKLAPVLVIALFYFTENFIEQNFTCQKL